MSADFWSMHTVPKAIPRADFMEQNRLAAQALQDKGCTIIRASRVNGKLVDTIWHEGWLTLPVEAPMFDEATLDPGRQI